MFLKNGYFSSGFQVMGRKFLQHVQLVSGNAMNTLHSIILLCTFSCICIKWQQSKQWSKCRKQNIQQWPQVPENLMTGHINMGYKSLICWNRQVMKRTQVFSWLVSCDKIKECSPNCQNIITWCAIYVIPLRDIFKLCCLCGNNGLSVIWWGCGVCVSGFQVHRGTDMAYCSNWLKKSWLLGILLSGYIAWDDKWTNNCNIIDKTDTIFFCLQRISYELVLWFTKSQLTHHLLPLNTSMAAWLHNQ